MGKKLLLVLMDRGEREQDGGFTLGLYIKTHMKKQEIPQYNMTQSVNIIDS